jgi:hypothetical protein
LTLRARVRDNAPTERGGSVPSGLNHTTAIGDEPREKECPTMRPRPLLSFGLLVVVALSLSGCKAINDFVAGTPVIKRVTVAAKIGQPGATVNGALKPGAPTDLPLWESADVTKTDVGKSDSGKSWSATLSTHDAYPDVVKGMAVGFQRAGWEVQSQDVVSGETSSTVLSVSGPSGAGIVTIAAQEDKTTQIAYIITAARN